jgi:hypothetical protein
MGLPPMVCKERHPGPDSSMLNRPSGLLNATAEVLGIGFAGHDRLAPYQEAFL